MRTLNTQSRDLGSLAVKLQSTLQSGTEAANALHATLLTFQQITGQFAPKASSTPGQEKAPPFDIRQYTAMLEQATATARELNALAKQTEKALPVLQSATRDTASELERVLNHLFLLLALLILVATLAILTAVVTYRRIMARFAGHDAMLNRGG